MHEWIDQDAVIYDLPTEEIIESSCRDNRILNKKLNELIMAVESKYPNESRHETALRYIRERESKSLTAGKDILKKKGVENEIQSK